MTVSGFILNRIRGIIGDSLTPYRWAESVLLEYLNEGREKLFSMRPEAFYVSEIVVSYPGDLLAESTLDLVFDHRSSMANYVAYRALSEDSEDPENRKNAQDYLAKFMAGV
jgi:hypothetical protein